MKNFVIFFICSCCAFGQFPYDGFTQQWLQTNTAGGVTAGYFAGSATPTSDAVRLGFCAGGGPNANLLSGVAIGRHAGYDANASQSVFLGHAAGQYAGKGGDAGSAVVLGYLAGRNAEQFAPHYAFFSVIIGTEAATNLKSAQVSTILGSRAGRNATTAVNSVLVGYGAAQSSSNVNDAVLLGANAGANAANLAGSVYIGSGAGLNYSRNSTLIIEGHGGFTGTASLIYGEFDTRLLRLNAAKMGFFGSAPITRPVVIGLRSDGTALDSLLQALHSLGLISDLTTP